MDKIKLAYTDARKQATSYLQHHWFRLFRGSANRAIASICSSKSSSENPSLLCEGLWDHPYQWFRVAMLREALKETYGTGLIGVYEESSRKEWLASLRSLPLSAEEKITSVIPATYSECAEELLSGVENYRDLYNLQIPGGPPGCYFYDGVLKKERIGQVDINNTRIKTYLARTLKYLDDYQGIIDRHDIKAAIVSHKVHFRYSTLVWKLLSNGIPVFLIDYINRHTGIYKMTSVDHMLKPYDDAPTVEELNSLSADERNQLVTSGKQYVKELLAGKEGQESLFNTYADENLKYRTRNQFLQKLGAESDKPIVVIMCTSWPDFPNGYGPTYFTDYVDWVLMTMSIIKNINTCNWILKPHPNELFYGDKTTLKKVAGDCLPKGIYYWPEDASTAEIATYVKCIVTARGTSAIEYAAAGLPTVCATASPFSDFGFSTVASSKDNYVKILQNVHEMPPLTQQQQSNACIFLASVQKDGNSKGTLIYPYGILGVRLYKMLPKYIKNNRPQIKTEIELMANWSISGRRGYNSYLTMGARTNMNSML